MADARIDIEAKLSGAREVESGLDVLKQSIKRAGDAGRVGTEDLMRLEKQENSLRLGTVGLGQAQLAMAQLMRGNLVGAARAAVMAIRSLTSAMISNPYLAVVAAVIALGAGLVKLIQHQIAAEKAAEEHRKKIAELKSTLNELKFGTVEERVKSLIKSLRDAGDEKGLEKNIRNIERALELAHDNAEDIVRVMGWLKPDSDGMKAAEKDYEQMVEIIKTLKGELAGYQSALDAVRDAKKRQAEEDEKAAQEERDATLEQIKLLEDKKAVDAARETGGELGALEAQKGLLEYYQRMTDKESERAKIANEIYDIEKKIADLKLSSEEKAAAEAEARKKSLESARDQVQQYQVSKLSPEQQLEVVEAQMQRLRGGGDKENPEDIMKMLGLVKRRDQLKQDIARGKTKEAEREDEEEEQKSTSRKRVYTSRQRLDSMSIMAGGRVRSAAARAAEKEAEGKNRREHEEQIKVEGIGESNNLLKKILENLK